MSNLYIGLMSGTSIDGIDAALVDFSTTTPRVLATHYQPYQAKLRQQILAICQPGDNEIARLGELDILLANLFADSVQALLKQAGTFPSAIIAIGSHGQTIRHAPKQFTLQIGDPNTIAAKTGITTVADFRRKDLALGGQGAPLVPAFHHSVFATNIDRAIVNIGGIANVTLLPKNDCDNIVGFDTGPGNTLLDDWIHTHLHKAYDEDGQFAASGKVNQALLQSLLADDYFLLTPPKSTGREYFNRDWLDQKLNLLPQPPSPEDVQATLVELTATSIVNAIKQNFTQGEIYVCGGGAHNQYLMSRIHALSTPNFKTATTAALGIDPEWVEAIAFAWLAAQTMQKKSGNLPSVTGAEQAVILGGIYYA